MDRLEREQRERYIELDQRLLELRGEQRWHPGILTVTPPKRLRTCRRYRRTEREAYNVAFELLNAARPLPESEQRPQYRRALVLFLQDVIDQLPQRRIHRQCVLLAGRSPPRVEGVRRCPRGHFAQVDLLYDDHPKVPDALYKLGEVYNMLGDSDRAHGNT